MQVYIHLKILSLVPRLLPIDVFLLCSLELHSLHCVIGVMLFCLAAKSREVVGMYTYFQLPVHWQPDQKWVQHRKPMSRLYTMTSTADHHPVSNDSLVLMAVHMGIVWVVWSLSYTCTYICSISPGSLIPPPPPVSGGILARNDCALVEYNCPGIAFNALSATLQYDCGSNWTFGRIHDCNGMLHNFWLSN